MEWFEIEHILPEPGKSIVIYSPIYDEDDTMANNPLLFRVISSQFISTAREATHWAYIEPPQS